MRRRLPFLAFFLLLLLATTQLHAAIHVSVGDLQLQPGEIGFVDVFISSDADDTLDTFGLEFRITTTGTSRLEFVNPPSDTQLGTPDYILFGDSVAELFPPAGSVSTTSTQNDTYIGGDGTLTGLGVTVPSANRLLARLAVTTATTATPSVGDTFTVSLEPTLSTFFYEPNFSLLTFTSSPGTVTAIPEPGMALIFATLGGLGIIIQAPRRRRSAPPKN